jgi:uncharacterized protein (TIGR03435 family)
MKKITLSILSMALSICASAQVKVGQNVPAIKFPTILNSPVKTIDLEELKGKVVLLEFWATWCGPCITAMAHLQELQKQFKGKLQVITISTEKEKRIKQFITTIPSNLWFAVDTADELRAVFPYHTIPHTVLIDGGGKVVAITEPANITAKIVANVIAGRPINLPLKEDNMIADPIKAYFNAADTVQSRLLIQPEIKGVSSMSKTYPTDSNFKNRRITMFNLPLETIYRIAYNDQPYGRVINLTPKENIKQNKTNYCIDLIVPKGHENELMPTLIKELQSRFDLKATIEKRNKEVYLLKIADTTKIKLLKPSTNKEETFSGGDGAFSGQAVKLSKIADYLEGFGLVNMPVVDETGSDIKYDIEFNYQPEKKGSLIDAIAALGLKLEKGERDINMLVFR